MGHKLVADAPQSHSSKFSHSSMTTTKFHLSLSVQNYKVRVVTHAYLLQHFNSTRVHYEAPSSTQLPAGDTRTTIVSNPIFVAEHNVLSNSRVIQAPAFGSSPRDTFLFICLSACLGVNKHERMISDCCFRLGRGE